MPPGRTVGSDLAAHARLGDLLVQFADELIEIGRVLTGGLGLVAELLGLGALLDPEPLVLGSRVGADIGFVLEVPALSALRGPQRLSSLSTGRADVRESVPAGDEHCVNFACVEVGTT